MATRAQKRGRELYEIANELPYQVHDVLQEIRDGQIEVGFVHKGLDEFMHKLDVIFNRLVIALVVAGGLLGSSLIGILATDGPQIFGIHFLSVARLHHVRRARRVAADRRAPQRPDLEPLSPTRLGSPARPSRCRRDR